MSAGPIRTQSPGDEELAQALMLLFALPQETIDSIGETRRQRIPTPKLNKFLEEVTTANPPISPGRKHVRILYGAQIGVAPPSFVFFTNVATTFHFSYDRFLVNQLRQQFEFYGTPIRFQVRRRAK